ncbi:hypothetical protein BO85DRAFT_261143 [Aspergillus piperis CBS 112811]|uniref:MFS general substrate transporter n=1 Tax=Aspergillus piperis CBS 112811 TaxID=1448313 RepID=A0A8G1VQT6_9EURO|nr:hypothetical protein BO85DRAFT_261143 [Aspergillus piperis CBS 112811]RAH59108.1 hypothetical protein BO85DRAFT_261143 [Aspergillus piperis CBS 112811]
MGRALANPGIWVWFLSGNAVLSEAVPLPVINESPRKRDTCGFDGNPDLYGLGIRLGIYLQWISSSLIYGLDLDGRDEIMQNYAVFTIALTIAVIVITVQSEPTFAVEIFVLTYIIFGGAYTVLISGFGRPNILMDFLVGRKEQKLRAITVMGAIAAGSIYCGWFWLRGIFNNFHETPCGTHGFLFAKVSLFDPSVRRFFAFLSVLLALSYTVGPLYLRYVHRILKIIRKLEPKGIGGSAFLSLHDFTPKTTNHIEPTSSMIAAILSASTLIYSILGIELTLYWNSIRGVYSIKTTGQLIPFVIGVTGFIIVLLNILTNFRGKHSDADKATTANERLQYLDLAGSFTSESVQRSRRYWRKWRLLRRVEKGKS